jgi:mRNA-degrading endonuclease YafQ of YafQ-DinJ toxin-antitoxin module
MGTNEQGLIDIVCLRTPAELGFVSVEYQKQFKRDLLVDIKDETSGGVEKVLTACLRNPAEIDAVNLNTAVKGLGTNEALLLEVLCTRSRDELGLASLAYKKLFGKDLAVDVKDDVSGDFGQMCLKCLDPMRGSRKCDVAADLAVLYTAGEGKMGTNEAKFIEILVGSPRAHCEALFHAYATKHGKALDVVIKSEMSGPLGRGLSLLVTPLPVIFSEKIYGSMKGAGTNDCDLIRFVTSNRGRLGPIGKRFVETYRKSISAMVTEETSGDYRTSLIKLLAKEGC